MAEVSKKRPPPSPARKMAWHVASDITWVAIYRGAMLGLLSLVITLIGWQSNRIITKQDDLSKQVGELKTDITVEQTRVMNLAADIAKNATAIHDEEKRLNRTNERQIEMSKEIAVIQSQLADLRAGKR